MLERCKTRIHYSSDKKQRIMYMAKKKNETDFYDVDSRAPAAIKKQLAKNRAKDATVQRWIHVYKVV